MKIPLHVKMRKKFREYLYKLLAQVKPTKPMLHTIDKTEIKSIIIIRPNYRIGNLIFLTPLINELQKELPDVKIDLIVGMKLAGDILQEMPNVEHVISISRELLLHPLKMLQLIKTTRTKHYDVALNISAGSLSSEIVTAFVNAKYKASFESEKTLISLTHSVKYEHFYTHSGSRPLELLKLFNIELPSQELELDIKLNETEKKIAQQELYTLLKNNNLQHNTKIISLFRNARFDKKISDEWWNEWHQELLQLDNEIILIDILSPDIITKLNENVLEYSNKNLRILGAFFAHTNLYVSADTGPLHLSCASNAPTLALFNKTNPAIYGTLGKQNKTLDINQLSPKEVAKLTYTHLQEQRENI